MDCGLWIVGESRHTANLAVEAIRRKWKCLREKHFHQRKRLRITADSGDSNGKSKAMDALRI
ncbi:ISAzo13-like element transposase-related protein [Planctomycetaceae bacterium SH139]